MTDRPHHPDGRPTGAPCPIWDNDLFIGPRQPLPELAPCPFCGPRAVPPTVVCDETPGGYMHIMCGGCGCSSGHRNARMGGDPVAGVIKSWNCRWYSRLAYEHINEVWRMLCELDEAIKHDAGRMPSYLGAETDRMISEGGRLMRMMAYGNSQLPSQQYREAAPSSGTIEL